MYIGEFCKLTGTSAKTIRYYEQLGLLPVPRRKGRYRIYDTTYVETVRQIKMAQGVGLTLRQMAAHMDHQDTRRGLPRAVIEKALTAQKHALLEQRDTLDSMLRRIEELEKHLSCSACP